MAVKQSYKIPYGLATSWSDMDIVLGRNGVNLRPLPIKLIMSVVVSVLLCFYMVTKGFVARGSGLQKFFFVVLWLAITLVLTKRDKAGQMQAEMLSPLFGYVPKAGRMVYTRSNCSANAFQGIAGIESVTPQGMVCCLDGTYEYWYRVVGSASIMLFPGDRDAIIDRVDSFYRKVGIDVDIMTITTKQAQQVGQQVSHIKRLYDNLPVRDDDLKYIANERFSALKYIGSSSYKSLHQYMVLKADNKEALNQAKSILQAEVENSSYMIKQCVGMRPAELLSVRRMAFGSQQTRKGVM